MRAEKQLLFWVAAAIALLLAVAVLREILLPFVVGAVVAYFLNPVADRLEALGLGRTAAAAVIVFMGAILVASFLVLVAPMIAEQVRQLTETLPAEFTRIKLALEQWAADRLGDRFPQFQAGFEKALDDLGRSLSGSAGTIAMSLWSRGLAFVNLISLLLITPVVIFYLLVDWHPILARIDTWLPRDHAGTIRRLANEINEAVSAFIRGQGVICIFLGALYGIGLTLVGLHYGFLIGVVTGILAFIPIVGWVMGLLVAGVLALMQAWPDLSLFLKVVGVFTAGIAIDSAILSPKIVGKKIGLHPVWLMFALFVFSYLFGFVGTLVAVPVAAAIGVLVRFALEIYLGSEVYRGKASDPQVGGPS